MQDLIQLLLAVRTVCVSVYQALARHAVNVFQLYIAEKVIDDRKKRADTSKRLLGIIRLFIRVVPSLRPLFQSRQSRLWYINSVEGKCQVKSGIFLD